MVVCRSSDIKRAKMSCFERTETSKIVVSKF